MLRLVDAAGVAHPLSDYTDYHITHNQDSQDTMSFCLPTNHAQYRLLAPECIVRTVQNEYLIKKIDDDRIDCELNFDFLRQRFYRNYTITTQTLSAVLTEHLPQGWAVDGAGAITVKRSIEITGGTDYDIVMACMETYGVNFVWHILDKRLEVIVPASLPVSGKYLTSELNLRKLAYKGQTSDFATRLYAYGADGMTLETAAIGEDAGGTVFYGKTYVEDHSYSDKIVCAYWSDERYTVPEHLYEAALQRLHSMAAPVTSYECDVVDLARLDSRYAHLSFALHAKVMLIDADRNTRMVHQVVEYDEWPDEPINNTVTLSSVPGTIQSKLRAEVNQLKTADAELSSRITKTDAQISAEVENRQNAEKQLRADIQINAKEISAKVSQSGGETKSFGWTLNVESHTWYANNSKVFAISKDGAEIIGKITATSGEIGGCKIVNGKLEVDGANITGELNAKTINVTNLNASNISQGELPIARLGDKTIPGTKLGDYTVGNINIATDGINNRCISSGSIATSTCNSEIQGYFADIIETQKLFAGTAVVGFLRTQVLKADKFSFSNSGAVYTLSVVGGVVQAVAG